MDRLRVGVLGYADIAGRRVLPAMAGSAAIELVAIASRDRARAQEAARAHGCRPVHGYAALLEDAEVEAVYLPLPNALHAEWIEACLRSGRHVLAEKPLTTDYQRTVDLVALARARGLVLMENVMFVHHPQHRAAKRLLTEGAIGELRSFRAQFTVPRRAPDDIRHKPELGGGALWDTGVYPIRAALYFLGPNLRVAGAVRSVSDRFRVDVSGAALLSTPRGVTAELEFGLDHGYRSVYELCGSEGRLTVDRAFTPPADYRPVLHLEQGSVARDVELPAADQVALTLAAFAAAVRTGDFRARASERQARLVEDIRRVSGGRRS